MGFDFRPEGRDRIPVDKGLNGPHEPTQGDEKGPALQEAAGLPGEHAGSRGKLHWLSVVDKEMSGAFKREAAEHKESLNQGIT